MSNRSPVDDLLRSASSAEWDIQELRWGGGTSCTLQEIGTMYGVSRERIRQKETKSAKKIIASFCQNSGFWAKVNQSTHIWLPYECKTPSEGMGRLNFALANCGSRLISLDEYQRVISAIRMATYHSPETVTSVFSRLALSVATLDAPLVGVPVVVDFEKSQLAKRAPLPKTYKQQSIAVLREKRQPMHYIDIAKSIEERGWRDRADIRQVLNALQFHKNVFARLNAGTYGLMEQGYTSSPFVRTRIIEVLSELGHPTTKEYLTLELRKVRADSASSVSMYLDMNPDFYRSIEGTYGLRDWLLPDSQQTIRTPKAYIEDPKSRRRET